MRQLNISQKTSILRCLVEGNSLHSTTRITGYSRKTISRLLIHIGKICQKYQEDHLINLNCKTVEMDEIWSFVGCKEKSLGRGKKGLGDVWTWIAFDPETKLVIHWETGARKYKQALDMMNGLKKRAKGRFQLTTDGLKEYAGAAEAAFKGNIDFAMVVKDYQGNRYQGSTQTVMAGNPDPTKISTSLIERQNLTMRMGIRRFTRSTDAFSKKLENHKCAIALHFFYYNFIRFHTKIETTPAIAAKVTKKRWRLEDLAEIGDYLIAA